ncbi:hypothetical protein [Maritimibacter sp. UBA3975]|uniref:hypothetical protein n=1 Tax=Maritimibacter sp. UBA3975 TaxID=1946833 RepID=UPI000C0A2AC4|nr:hypothetical protein [Maritimibacter sp. UBA3975]MAM60836.1 hypothetical protein [Maritimibacter sp.]|tara:strand:- start:3226 stop:3441 length:216 start_codon:yes stop_codon:yes gene_type:complete
MEKIFSIWPSLSDLAKDLGRPYPTVAAWKQRGSIPAKYDIPMIKAAERRGKRLTLETLARARAHGATHAAE